MSLLLRSLFPFRCASILPCRYFGTNKPKTAPAGGTKAPKSRVPKVVEEEMSEREKSSLEAFAKLDDVIDWDAFIKFAESPPVADTRTVEEIAYDEEVERVYAMKSMERLTSYRKIHENIVIGQRKALAALPDHLRMEALFFDPILPPAHPRLAPPREYPTLPKARQRYIITGNVKKEITEEGFDDDDD